MWSNLRDEREYHSIYRNTSTGCHQKFVMCEAPADPVSVDAMIGN